MAIDLDLLAGRSAADQLKAVEEAIVVVAIGGQEVTYGDGRKITRADLDSLRRYRDDLRREVSAGGSGGNAVAQFSGRY